MIRDPVCSTCKKPMPFRLQPVMVNGHLSGVGHVCTNELCLTTMRGGKPGKAAKNQPSEASTAGQKENWFKQQWLMIKEKLNRKKAA